MYGDGQGLVAGLDKQDGAAQFSQASRSGRGTISFQVPGDQGFQSRLEVDRLREKDLSARLEPAKVCYTQSVGKIAPACDRQTRVDLWGSSIRHLGSPGTHSISILYTSCLPARQTPLSSDHHSSASHINSLRALKGYLAHSTS